jgi:hypothetical protein
MAPRPLILLNIFTGGFRDLLSSVDIIVNTTVQRVRMKKGSAKLHWAGGGRVAKCPVLRVNEPTKTSARSARECSVQNPLVKNKRLMKRIRGTRMHGYQGNYANTCRLEHANVCKYQLTGTVSHNSMTQEVGWYDLGY